MLWRLSKPARSRRAPPAEFCVPCQPTLSPHAPTGPGWLHEVKYDGYRLLARKSGERVRLWSRNVTEFTDHFAGIAAAVAALPADSVTLDGEAVVFHLDGHSNFAALRSRDGGKRAVLVAFDCLRFSDEDLRALPVEERRARLAGLLDPGDDRIQFSHALAGDGDTIFRHACGHGLEGIVSKRLGSRYRSGRSSDWLKTKNPAFIRR